MIKRERSVDTGKMSTGQIDELSLQIGDKLREICDEAVEKANKFLKIYGMSSKMQIVIDHKDLAKTGIKKKRGRPRKATPNL